jgi:hypothetical protein
MTSALNRTSEEPSSRVAELDFFREPIGRCPSLTQNGSLAVWRNREDPARLHPGSQGTRKVSDL